MKQTEKNEVVNFVLSTLSDGSIKTGTQLMELFVVHAGLQEFNRKNLKQVFHRVCLSLAEQRKLAVIRQLGSAPLLFSVPTHDQNMGLRKDAATTIPNDIGNTKDVPTLTKQLEELAEQEAMLAGREKGLRMLFEIAPEKRELFEVEFKKIRYQRKTISACLQVIEEFGYFS